MNIYQFCLFLLIKAGWTGTLETARFGHSACLEVLREAGCDLGQADNDGVTPAHWAAGHGHDACLIQLQSAGCNLDLENKSGDTTVHHAVLGNHRGCLISLMNGGCNLLHANNNGHKPLYYADPQLRSWLIEVLAM